MPRRGAYVTTKTAVVGLTRTVGVEWAQRGVRCNSIGPGYHLTPLLKEYIDSGKIDQDRIRRRIPMGRLGDLDEIGKVVVFLASDLASYVTGQHLMVDGGYTIFGAPEDASV
jgi:NAD(P)-dependent dehydrogenase (short-subunit alcohol dehydrogenase family)